MLKGGVIKSLIVLGVFAYFVAAASVPDKKDEQRMRYDNYKVYKVKIENEEEFKQLMALENVLKVLRYWTYINTNV